MAEGAMAPTRAGGAPPTLWTWLEPARAPRTAQVYTAYAPFFALTRHILGVELVDMYGALVLAPATVTTYAGLLGPSLGPSLGGVVPAVDCGWLPFTPALRRAAMAAASVVHGCGYCTGHTMGVGGLLSGTYRGRGGGVAEPLLLCPLSGRDPAAASVAGGGGGSEDGKGCAVEAAVVAYATAAAASPPAVTAALDAAAAAALGGNAAAMGTLRSSVAYTGFLNVTMGLLDPPLEAPLLPWVAAVVAATPALSGHPVEAKITPASGGEQPPSTAPGDGGGALPPAPPQGALPTVVGRLAHAAGAAARLLPALVRVPGATERLLMGGVPRDVEGVRSAVAAAMGGYLPPIFAAGLLPHAGLVRAVGATYIIHFGPDGPEGGGGGATAAGAGSGHGADGAASHARRVWDQAARVGLLAHFAATAGDAALAAEAAALASVIGGGAPPPPPPPPAAVAIARRLVEVAAARLPGGVPPADVAAVAASGVSAAGVVEVVGLAGFCGYLQRLWGVFLGEAAAGGVPAS